MLLQNSGFIFVFRYYDAASDGFFYEMASVDGWRRRQPLGISPPGNSSPINALLNGNDAGQKKRQLDNLMQHQQMKPTLPLQLQSYIGHQLSHKLTNAELEEIILNHQHGQSAPLGSFGGSVIHEQKSTAQTNFCTSSAMPTSCCCCQAAAAAQILLRDRMHHHLIPNPVGHTGCTQHAKSGAGCCCGVGIAKCSDGSFVSEIENSSSSPSNQKFGSMDSWQLPNEGRHNSVSQMEKWKSGARIGVGNDSFAEQPANTTVDQTDFVGWQQQKTLVGSFEEPYEFYWSDSDAKSNNSVASTNTVVMEPKGMQNYYLS